MSVSLVNPQNLIIVLTEMCKPTPYLYRIFNRHKAEILISFHIMQRFLLVLIFLVSLSSCAVKKHADISYLSSPELEIKSDGEIPKLNVFNARKISEEKKPVLIFVYGGNWNTGNKDIYGFLGRNFVKHGVVSVLPNYTLSPKANYDTMAKQVAEAIKWTQDNIAAYGGDPTRIYLTGHSAGGHLVALAALNPKYNINPKDISGIILNDAAALDMKHYLENNPPTTENDYLTTWTNDPAKWQDASPVYFLSEKSPPFKIYLGSKTYQSIKTANARFLEELHNYQPEVQAQILEKKHIPMVLQYFWPWSKRYDEIVEFMGVSK
ncbi:MAG: alpha/beta hydrolase [Patiriisocius sp.]|uniref:alpha/beta hydrolase n=1 Tax=Patiriisocius sp. TaxID=2822396 RepID=UPI003EF60929